MSDKIAFNFSKNLYTFLKVKHMTIKELSDKTGLKIDTLESYLGYNQVPILVHAYVIAKALDVSVDLMVRN